MLFGADQALSLFFKGGASMDIVKRLLLILVVCMSLVGCSNDAKEIFVDGEAKEPIAEKRRFSEPEQVMVDRNENTRITIITDNETGCKYIRERVINNGHAIGLTVLLKADGTPDCGQ